MKIISLHPLLSEEEECFISPKKLGMSKSYEEIQIGKNGEKDVEKKNLDDSVIKGSATYLATWNSKYKDQYAKYLKVQGYEDDENMWE